MAIFFHDHKLIHNKSDDKYYSSGGLSYSVMSRYFNIFGSIDLCTRTENSNNNKYLTIVSGDHVNIIPLIDIRSNIFKNYNILRKQISTHVKSTDFVISRLPSLNGLIALRYAKKYKKKHIVELVGCPYDSLMSKKIVFNLLAPIYMQYLKRVIRKSKNVIYVTDYFLQKRYPTLGRSTSISNVELPSTKKISYDDLKISIEEKKRTYKIGLIGNLSKLKGTDTAIQAIDYLNNKGKNFELHLLGSGDVQYWKDYAKYHKIEGKIFFHQPIKSGEFVFEWLDKLDLYIQPSRQEGLPRASIEAMSRGLPIIASSVAGIPELIDNNWLHKKGDFICLGQLIEKMTSNDDFLIKQSVKNLINSEKYLKEKLDHKRDMFFNTVIEE